MGKSPTPRIYYARLTIKRFEYELEAFKELLSTLTSDERWATMVEL